MLALFEKKKESEFIKHSHSNSTLKHRIFCCLFLCIGREDRKIDKMIPHSDPYVQDGKRSTNAFTLISMAEVNENEFA